MHGYKVIDKQNNGISVNKNALENAKIHRLGKKYARDGLQQPAAAQEELARVSAECVCVCACNSTGPPGVCVAC